MESEKDYEVYKAYLEEFIKRAEQNIKEVIEAHNAMGDDGVPWGSYDMSPAHFREWIFADLKRTVDLVRKAGKYVGFYMVGEIRDQLPIALEARPHYIEPFERQSNITLGEAKKLYGKKICVMGNFDPVTLAFGSVRMLNERRFVAWKKARKELAS